MDLLSQQSFAKVRSQLGFLRPLSPSPCRNNVGSTNGSQYSPKKKNSLKEKTEFHPSLAHLIDYNHLIQICIFIKKQEVVSVVCQKKLLWSQFWCTTKCCWTLLVLHVFFLFFVTFDILFQCFVLFFLFTMVTLNSILNFPDFPKRCIYRWSYWCC